MCAARREPFTVFGFPTTHAALAAESHLMREAIAVVPVPTPKSIGNSCGIALRVPRSQAARARDSLGRAGLEPGAAVDIDDVVAG